MPNNVNAVERDISALDYYAMWNEDIPTDYTADWVFEVDLVEGSILKAVAVDVYIVTPSDYTRIKDGDNPISPIFQLEDATYVRWGGTLDEGDILYFVVCNRDWLRTATVNISLDIVLEYHPPILPNPTVIPTINPENPVGSIFDVLFFLSPYIVLGIVFIGVPVYVIKRKRSKSKEEVIVEVPEQ